MNTVIAACITFPVIFLLMSLGVILNNKCIKGSCGGLNKLMGEDGCESCEKKDECPTSA